MKCRVWNVYEKEMIYPSAIGVNNRNGVYVDSDGGGHNLSVEGRYEPGNTFKLMLYTCMKDMNDVDIFESYIVEFSAFGRTVRGIVEWDIDDGLPGFVIVDTDGSGTIWNFMYDDLVVVGNIYENPDLLDVVDK